MDWIEKITGFSPDHGTGVLELEILAAVGLLVVLLSAFSRLRGRAGIL
jgi:hypothetical protein